MLLVYMFIDIAIDIITRTRKKHIVISRMNNVMLVVAFAEINNIIMHVSVCIIFNQFLLFHMWIFYCLAEFHMNFAVMMRSFAAVMRYWHSSHKRISSQHPNNNNNNNWLAMFAVHAPTHYVGSLCNSSAPVINKTNLQRERVAFGREWRVEAKFARLGPFAWLATMAARQTTLGHMRQQAHRAEWNVRLFCYCHCCCCAYAFCICVVCVLYVVHPFRSVVVVAAFLFNVQN